MHESFSAIKYENADNSLIAEKFSCSAILSEKELAIISNLSFISKRNFMFSWVEHEKSFITSAPDQGYTVCHSSGTILDISTGSQVDFFKI